MLRSRLRAAPDFRRPLVKILLLLLLLLLLLFAAACGDCDPPET